MRAQICFFVSIVFGFVARGAVTGNLNLAGAAPSRPQRSLAAAAHVSFFSLRRLGVPGSRRRVPRFAGRFRPRRRLWRYRRRGARFANAGLTARQARHHRGLGIQSLGQRRYPPCQLRRHSVRRPSRSIGRCLFSPNVYRAALSDHARPHVLASTAKRKQSPGAGRAAGSPKVSRAPTYAAHR